MSLTGVIYGGIVVLWLCYLVPLALRRYDEASRARSVDRFSAAMRVLGRTHGSARHSPRARTAAGVQARRSAAAGVQARRSAAAGVQARRSAAASAARRRRRVLGALLLLGAVVGTLAAVGVLGWWTPVLGFAPVAGFLVAARSQVSRVRTREWETALTAGATGERAPAAPAGRPTGRPTGWTAGPSTRPGTDVAMVVLDPLPETRDDAAVDEATRPGQQAAPVATAGAGSVWDPLPVTLPTYVSKPRASRTVRTIDLGAPGTWTSGRLSEQELATAEQDARSAGGGGGGPGTGSSDAGTPARAVGD